MGVINLLPIYNELSTHWLVVQYFSGKFKLSVMMNYCTLSFYFSFIHFSLEGDLMLSVDQLSFTMRQSIKSSIICILVTYQKNTFSPSNMISPVSQVVFVFSYSFFPFIFAGPSLKPWLSIKKFLSLSLTFLGVIGGTLLVVLITRDIVRISERAASLSGVFIA